MSDPQQPGTPSPSEEERLMDMRDRLFVIRQFLAIVSWNEFHTTIDPILSAFARAARKAELEGLAMETCARCKEGWPVEQNKHRLIAWRWGHRRPTTFMECDAPATVHDRLAALAQEEQEAGNDTR